MQKIVYFDYCAIIFTCILLLSTISRGMTRGKQNRYFMYLIVLILVTSIADACSINLNLAGPGHVSAKYVAHTVYLWAHMATTPCYVTYLFALTDVWHRIHKQRLLTFLSFTPFIAGSLLMVINPFTDVIFYLDGTDTYTRGKWFLFLYAVAVFYAVFGLVHLFRHRRQFTVIQFLALSAVFLVSFAVAAIQLFMPNYVLEMLAQTAVLTFVSMMIQRPENLLDANTGLGKLAAYVTNVKNASFTEKPMEIIMLNIANYNILYEMLGYQSTNRMLRSIADQLVALSKRHNAGAEFYYLGDGKFRIVMDNCHFNLTNELAGMVCRAMRSGFLLNQMTINLLAYVCIARFPEDIDNIDSLLAFGSDLNTLPYTGQVMYASEVYKKEYYDIQKDIDRIIEKALAEQKFEVYYQPIYSVAEGRFNSAEALLRLKTEKYGFISPELFIPAAEKSGAIHKIGSFVIDEVCKFISEEDFQDLGIDYIEVNLSVAQCMQNNLAAEILDTLKKYHVNPSQLNLEITETAASYSQNIMMENVNMLKDAGIRFSLDDFGTGYSNMRRIASLPLHIVKLDKSFTSVEENPKLMIVLENTIRMIKDMNMKIVVEGIETENMVRQFSDLECEYIQGYFYSKPIPKTEFIKFIKSAKNPELIAQA